MCTLNVDGKINRNQQEIVDTFNKYMDKWRMVWIR
jgi:hypothetical protein